MTNVKLELLTDIDILLMVEKCKVKYFMQYIDMLKQIKNIWKIIMKILSYRIWYI